MVQLQSGIGLSTAEFYRNRIPSTTQDVSIADPAGPGLHLASATSTVPVSLANAVPCASLRTPAANPDGDVDRRAALSGLALTALAQLRCHRQRMPRLLRRRSKRSAAARAGGRLL